MACNMFRRLWSPPLGIQPTCLNNAGRHAGVISRPIAYRPSLLVLARPIHQPALRPGALSSRLGLSNHFNRVPASLPHQYLHNRSFSLFKPPKIFRTFTKWQRRLSFISAFGGGILLTIFIGPILLVAVGGAAAVFWWRYWRHMRSGSVGESSVNRENLVQSPLSSIGSLFSNSPAHLTEGLQTQAIERIKDDLNDQSSDIGRYLATQSPNQLKFSDVYAESTSKSTAIHNGRREDKSYISIEFSLTAGEGHGTKGIAQARGTTDGEHVNLERLSVYWPQWNRETVLSGETKNGTNINRGSVIEGEFRDV
ncbi:hypothetical protein INT43_000152 [Umbelopsis isabellina]|uniref:Uncharacterized protein n=1 Tax=Mortierella isabellina TaxID=91625 RepID=A0A8H7U872_MORIS|nr:hypothetical protein INT43_000152 [Umbelopsis isabellina]